MSTSAKVTARQRIENLLDDNSFVEIGAYVKARNTDFNIQPRILHLTVLLPDMVLSMWLSVCLQPGCVSTWRFCRRNAR